MHTTTVQSELITILPITGERVYSTNYLPLPEQDFNAVYTIQLNIIEQQTVQTNLQYQVQTKYITAHQKIGSNPVLQISKQNFLINGKVLETAIDISNITAASALYPLVLQLDTNNVVQGIKQYEHIKKRWQNIKTSLLQQYNGELFDDYMQEMENTIHNVEKLAAVLQRDVFIHIYTMPIYTTYNIFAQNLGNDKEKQGSPTWMPQVAGQHEVLYDSQWCLKTKLYRNNNIQILGKGNLIDDRDTAELTSLALYTEEEQKIQRKESVTGNWNGEWLLDAVNRHISQANCTCSINMPLYKKQWTIQINKID